jgi:glycosyltransferase involved in cell wall biosynthesis
MPSYHDSQGVMACEMAAFGIPVVVSDIPATQEMLKSVKKKFFLKNQSPKFNAEQFFKHLDNSVLNIGLKKQLSVQNTIDMELSFIMENTHNNY